VIWYSKEPPIYVFVGDYWQRQDDGKVFLMDKNCFRADDKIIEYTKKNKIFTLGK
jgi:hypothetical protein